MPGRELAIQVLKFGLALGLIFYLFQKGLLDLSVLASLLNPQFVVIGLLLTGTNLLISGWRWFILLKSRGFPISFWQSYSMYLIGLFFNYALPGSVGGDVVKAYYIAQDHKERRMEAVMSVAVDRILGLYSMALIALGAAAWNYKLILSRPDLTSVGLSTLALLSVMTLFFATAFSQRVAQWTRIESILNAFPGGAILLRAYQAAQLYGRSKSTIFKSILLSAVSQMIAVIFMIQVGKTLNEDISLGAYFFAVPLGFIVSSVPISPAGLGVGQVAFLVLFQMYSGKESHLGQTAITAFQVALLMWGFVGAICYLRRRRPAV